jgi:hypothetical protein
MRGFHASPARTDQRAIESYPNHLSAQVVTTEFERASAVEVLRLLKASNAVAQKIQSTLSTNRPPAKYSKFKALWVCLDCGLGLGVPGLIDAILPD